MQPQQRKLKYHVAATLDGFIAREDDTSDFFPTDLSTKVYRNGVVLLQYAVKR